MSYECCEVCRFYGQNVNATRGDVHYSNRACTRFPPVVVRRRGEFRDAEFQQPETDDANWCGEYQPATPTPEDRSE